MFSALLKSLLTAAVFLAVIASCVTPSLADDTPADKYNLSGSVLSVTSKHGYFYQVASDTRIYLLMCTKVKSFQFGSPECKVGDKVIAKDDTIHFRVDGDWAYMTPVEIGIEEKLRILTTELKVIPPVPASTAPAPVPPTNGKGAPPAPPEPGVVIGTGMQVKGQHGVGWSTLATGPASGIATASPSTPVMATGPVTAIPVTGGAPVIVMPTGPTTGGVVTGVPVTGGAPITAIPTAPVMGTPVGGAPAGGLVIGGGGSAPAWVHVLRIQTAGKIYQLEGSGKPFTIENKEVALGDNLSIRIDKKHAYLSSTTSGTGIEQELKILSVTDVGAAPDTEKH